MLWNKIKQKRCKKKAYFWKWSRKDPKILKNEAKSIQKFWEYESFKIYPSLDHLVYPHMNTIGWRELNGNENVSSDNFLINYDLSSDNKLLLRSHNRIQYVLIHTFTTFSSINERWWSAFLSFRLLIPAQPSMKDWGISWKP